MLSLAVCTQVAMSAPAHPTKPQVKPHAKASNQTKGKTAPTSKPSGSFWHDQEGNPVADSDERKCRNNFGAQIMLTNDQNVMKNWYETPYDVAPKIIITHKTKRNHPILMPIIFANPKLDAQKRANVTCDFTIRKPNGMVNKPRELVLWSGPSLGPPNALQMGKACMGEEIEKTDPKGTYVVEAIVHDKNAKIDIPLKTTFTVDE